MEDKFNYGDTTLRKRSANEGRKIVCISKQNETACCFNQSSLNSVQKN